MKGSKGVTLTELILVIGILSVVVLSSSTLISQFMSSHQLIQTRDEVNEFGSALSKYFSLKDQCRSSLGGVTLMTPTPPSTPGDYVAAPPLTIANFTGFLSEVPAATPGPPTLQNGFMISRSSRVGNLGIQLKPATQFMPFRKGMLTRYRTTAQIQLMVELLKGDQVQPLPTRYFEVPVTTVTNTSPAVIEDCLGTMDLQSACQLATGNPGDWDSATQTCNTTSIGGSKCMVVGFFSVYSKSDPTQPDSPTTGQLNNPVTSNQACPAGSVPRLTGGNDFESSYSCGKKCTRTVYHHETYYSCVICP